MSQPTTLRPLAPGGLPRGMLPRARALLASDDGMSTAEYAIGTIAAAAFAAVLYAVVTGDSVVAGLTGLVQRALSVGF
ncbi:MAG: DUF4244 domain-containing protein [Haloechinothrix sp.]